MSDYTPSTDEVREAVTEFFEWHVSPQEAGDRFDRWLESVRAEERARIARALRAEVWPIADERTEVDRALEAAAQIAEEGA